MAQVLCESGLYLNFSSEPSFVPFLLVLVVRCKLRSLVSLVSVQLAYKTSLLGRCLCGLVAFDDDDYTPGVTPFGRPAQQFGRGSPTPSHPFGDHGQSTMFTLPTQGGSSLPAGPSHLSAASNTGPPGSSNNSNGGGMFSMSNGSGMFAPPSAGHVRGESDTSLQSFRFDPPPRAKRKGSFASLKAAFKSGTSGKSVPPVPKHAGSSSQQLRRPSTSAASSRIAGRSMHSAAPSYAASELSDGGVGNSSFGGFGGYNGFNITTNNGFGPADEEIPPVPQLPPSQNHNAGSRDLSSSGGFKFGGARPRNVSTATSRLGGSTVDVTQNIPIPRPQRPITPYENGDASPDPKTPAEYALHAVFLRFVTEVEQKMGAFLKEPLVRLDLFLSINILMLLDSTRNRFFRHYLVLAQIDNSTVH